MINGILVINKSKGMTSGDVVYKLRKILKTRKVGHAETLDPEDRILYQLRLDKQQN